jgi:N-methylhydantoinase B
VGDTESPLSMSSTGFVKSLSMGIGTAGGYPATGGRVWHAENAGVRDAFARGSIPAGPDALRELAPHGFTPGARADNRLGLDDVFELIANPGAGWGDPLDREPVRVARDVADGRLRPEDAPAIYGVGLTADGEVDREATDALRQGLRQQRLAVARPPRQPMAGRSDVGTDTLSVIEGVAIVDVGEQRHFACAHCGRHLSNGDETYRLGCAELDRLPQDVSAMFTSAEDETGTQVVMRSYICPGCGSLLDVGLCHPDDSPYCDVRLL